MIDPLPRCGRSGVRSGPARHPGRLSAKARRTVADLPVLDRKPLMIAGAVATAPRTISLDEPVEGLAAEEIDVIMALVHRLRTGGITVVLIEHVMRFLLQLSTPVLIMRHGRAIFAGPPDKVAEDRTVVETHLGAGTTGRLKRCFEGRRADDRAMLEAAAADRESPAGEPHALVLADIVAGYGGPPILDGVSLAVGAGELRLR